METSMICFKIHIKIQLYSPNLLGKKVVLG